VLASAITKLQASGGGAGVQRWWKCVLQVQLLLQVPLFLQVQVVVLLLLYILEAPGGFRWAFHGKGFHDVSSSREHCSAPGY
jgi:hypothetical protein